MNKENKEKKEKKQSVRLAREPGNTVGMETMMNSYDVIDSITATREAMDDGWEAWEKIGKKRKHHEHLADASQSLVSGGDLYFRWPDD